MFDALTVAAVRQITAIVVRKSAKIAESLLLRNQRDGRISDFPDDLEVLVKFSYLSRRNWRANVQPSSSAEWTKTSHGGAIRYTHTPNAPKLPKRPPVSTATTGHLIE